MRALILVPVLLLSACGGGSSGNNNSSDTSVPPFVDGPFVGGAFYGNVDTGPRGPFIGAEAVLSPDGQVRIGLADASGTVDRPVNPVVYSQIVGRVSTSDVETWTSALIAGETCSSSSEQWGCGVAAPIEIRFTLWGGRDVVAELRGETSFGTGTFTLALRLGNFADSVSLKRDQGLWPLFSDFAVFPDTAATSIDPDGAVFFQSSTTGCTGNGRLTPSGEGRVYSVELSIGNCNSEFGRLNTDLAGLASYEGIDAWGGQTLRFLLSTPEGSLAPVALRMELWKN